MSAQARYFRVGIFVFLGAATILAGVVVLGGRGFLAEPIVFETVFDESVQGLEIGSPVKFRGVKIGQVATIGFVNDYYPADDALERLRNAERILVRFEALPEDLPENVDEEERRNNLTALVEEGLRLRLTTQGITGTSFVEADIVDPAKNPPLRIYWEPEHLYVPSTPSTITRLTSAAERLFGRLDELDVEKVISNLDDLIVTLNGSVKALNTGSLRRELAEVLDEATATLARTRQSIDGGRYDLELALENVRVASENLRDLTETLRGQPSLLLRSSAPEDGGPNP